MLDPMIMVVAGIFGLIIGSFLNVVVLRSGTGKTLGGRSGCMSCGKTLTWYELIPVLSWVIQGGKCRGCGASISVQYPLVEASTALLFALAAGGSQNSVSLTLSLIISALLVAIAAYDLLHTIIPNTWVYTFAVCALLYSLSYAPLGYAGLITSLEGTVVTVPLFLLWLASSGRWMGFGDVKLTLGIGWLLGPLWGGLALYLAFIIGALVSVCVILPLPRILAFLSRRGITRLSSTAGTLTMKSEVPFGPFLIVGTCIAWGMMVYGAPFPFFL